MSEQPVRVAFIGAGYMSREHMKAMAYLKGKFVLAGIYSRTWETAKKVAENYKIENVEKSISELYEKTRAELLVVAVPELELPNVIPEIVKFPWIPLIEKPVGINIRESKKIANIFESEDKKAFVALNRRFYDSTIQIHRALSIDNGSRFIRVVDQEDTEAARTAGQPEEVIANWMYANSIHIIDYIPQFCRGKIEKITRKFTSHGRSNFVTADIHYDSGDVAQYSGIWNSPAGWSVNINTDFNEYELKPLELIRRRAYQQREFTEGTVAQIDLIFKPGLVRMAEECYKEIKTSDSTLPTLESNLATMKLISDIYACP